LRFRRPHGGGCSGCWPGTLTIRRIDPLTIQSIPRADDDNAAETTRTSLAARGKTLMRRIPLDSAGVSSVSTEIYERQ
jgi:hypothetical protein